MPPELTRQLIDRHPDLLDPKMAFTCGSGWFKLLDETFAKMDLIARKSGWAIKVDFVKEKLGTLRLFWNMQNCQGTEECRLWNAILLDIDSAAHDRSSMTCEETGEYGSMCSKGGWLKTLSAEKAAELGFEVLS